MKWLRNFIEGWLTPNNKAKPKALKQRLSPEEIQRAAKERRAKALTHFPFELHAVAGKDALSKWQELKSANKGAPVIIPDDDNLENLLGPFIPDTLRPEYSSERSVEAILAAAAKLKFPDDLIADRLAEATSARASVEAMRDDPNARVPTIVHSNGAGGSHTLSREEAIALMLGDGEEPLGEWPEAAGASPELTVATDILSGKPLDRVYVAVIPTDDWTTIPAHLRWGGWNENPGPEWHVAALRSWRDRYGVQLVGLSFDVLNLTVARQPQTQEEAIALAREQYIYCADIVDQGVGTISQLAKDLMVCDWWYFWWD